MRKMDGRKGRDGGKQPRKKSNTRQTVVEEVGATLLRRSSFYRLVQSSLTRCFFAFASTFFSHSFLTASPFSRQEMSTRNEKDKRETAARESVQGSSEKW